MHEVDKDKTVFMKKHVNYRYKVMSFRIKKCRSNIPKDDEQYL